MTLYYSRLAERMTFFENGKNVGLIVCALASLTALFELLPGVIAIVASLGIGVLSIWSILDNHSYKLAVVRMVSERCRELETECRDFWLKIDRMSDEAARDMWRDIENRATSVTSKPESMGIKEKPRLNRKITRLTYQVMGEEFGAT